ncbi:MAG: L-aspartate oxidase, partial [Sulfurimonas sp.]
THYLMKKQYGMHCVSKELHNNVELSSILEFKNAMLIAEAMILSALARKESRGVHFRNDYPNKDDSKFNDASYLEQLSPHYFSVSFDSAMHNNIWHKLKKMFHIN